LKKFDSAVSAGDKEAVETAYKLAVKRVDHAVCQGQFCIRIPRREKNAADFKAQ
jgi:ribosomal protein S20